MRSIGRTSFSISDSRRKSLIVLTAFSMLGIILGTVIVLMENDLKRLFMLRVTQNMIKGVSELSFIKQLMRTFLPVALILIIQFFSGYFAFGQPFAVMTVTARGAACGMAAALTYLSMGIKGIFTVMFMILPFSLMSIAIVILGAREAAGMAWKIAKFSFFREEQASPERKLYLIKFAVLLIFSVIISLFDTVMYSILGDILG